MSAVARAIEAGVLPGRLWLYSTYRCNLECTYCLTESGPLVERRELTAGQMLEAADQAVGLGFTGLGVTGGEPFLAPTMPWLLAELADRLPVVVLTNATLFSSDALASRLRPLVGRPVALQVSLDAADAAVHDAGRGDDTFAAVVDAIPRLVGMGVKVRVATTVADARPDDLARLCELHRRLGVDDDDHVVRPIVRRGRGTQVAGAVAMDAADVAAELTLTADGAFWSPFGPTVRDGVLDTDLLVSRTTLPLARPANLLLRLLEGREPGADATLNIR